MKYFLILSFVFTSIFTSAHQIDMSTVLFSKTDDGKIVMQINSSLTAFQGEVNYNNPKNSYATPEEFQQLVIKHFYKNFSIEINGDTDIKLINPMVILGHETKLVAEVTGVPENVKSLLLKNEIFKDIHNNQSVVIFAIDGFPKNNNFVVNKENNYQLNLALIDNIWQVSSNDNIKSNYLNYIFAVLIIAIAIYGLAKMRKPKSSGFHVDI